MLLCLKLYAVWRNLDVSLYIYIFWWCNKKAKSLFASRRNSHKNLRNGLHDDIYLGSSLVLTIIISYLILWSWVWLLVKPVWNFSLFFSSVETTTYPVLCAYSIFYPKIRFFSSFGKIFLIFSYRNGWWVLSLRRWMSLWLLLHPFLPFHRQRQCRLLHPPPWLPRDRLLQEFFLQMLYHHGLPLRRQYFA